MTIKAYFQYKEQDATRYWNLTNANIRLKGILDGTGVISSVAGQLRVEVAPFTVQTFDGMTVVSDATETLTVTDDEVYYIVLYAKYQLFVDPTLVLQVMTAATYAAHPEKDYLITFVRLDIPPAAVEVLPADYDGSVRDGLTPLQRAFWRDAVANFASLPTDTQEVQDGDIRLTLDTHTAWVYNSLTTTWDALSVTSTLENVGGRQVEYFADWNRAINGNGLIGGNDEYGTSTTILATDPKLSIHDHSNVADTIGIGMIHAAVNGHRVDTRHIDYVMTTAQPAPAAPDRYDLVWLEVWRVETVTPETELHEEYSGASVAFSVVREALENLEVSSDEVAGANFDVNQVTSTDDNRFVVTKWRVWDMPDADPDNIFNPHYQVDFGVIKPQNIDGNNFARPVFGIAEGDVWRATSATAYDDYTWAIPLLVIQRTEDENFAINNAIKIIRNNGSRYVWNIYSTTEVDLGSRLTSISHISALSGKKDDTEALLASGCLNYPDLVLGTNTLTVPSGSTFHIDGYTYTLLTTLILTLPDAPLLATRHDLVYLEMTRASNPDERDTTETSLGEFTYYDTNRGFIAYQYQFNLAVADVGTDTTVEDAMSSAGFSNLSPGLYRDTVLADARTPVDNTIWAIPIALAHRLNQGVWDRSLNPNGGSAGTRPDARDWQEIYIDDVLDLRHKVVLPGEDLKGLLEDSQQRLLTGQLKTKMAQHPTWGSVYGTGHLEQTVLSVPGLPGANKLPADPDSLRYTWSDAAEYVVFGESFPANAVYSGPYVQWSGPANPATLTISSPPGAYIVEGADGSPIFAVQEYTATPTNLNGPGISDSSNGDNFDIHAPSPPTWNDTATDDNADGITYALTANWTNLVGINPAAGDARLNVYYWICYNKTQWQDGQGNDYNTLNQGFHHSPDEVLAIENLGVGNDPAIGPLARTMTYTNYSGASLTILNTDIAAAYPEFTGTINIYGAVNIFSATQGALVPNDTPLRPCSIELDDAYGSITLTPLAPLVSFANENLSILVLFDDTNIDGWFDFRQHTKSIMGPMFWETFTWTPAAGEGSVLFELTAGQYSLSIDEIIKEDVRNGGLVDYAWSQPGKDGNQALVYWRTAGSPPGTPWDLTSWSGAAAEPEMRVGGMDSHVLTFMFETVPSPALTLEFLFIIPVVQPADPADEYLFTTKYTPYQGKDPVLAADLEDDLHGVCVASGDPTLTTRGTNDPRIQVLNEDSGWIERVDNVSVVSDDPQRSLAIHNVNDTYCLIQPWRLDYATQRHCAGNISERLPNIDPDKFILIQNFLYNWGNESGLLYNILPTSTILSRNESTDLVTSGKLPSADPFLNPESPAIPDLAQYYKPNVTKLLKSGSVIKWPDGINPVTKANIRSAGTQKGKRGWTVSYPSYYVAVLADRPSVTASYLPGGGPSRWNTILQMLGIVNEEIPEFFSMGVEHTQTGEVESLGYHSSLISPQASPGVLKMQVTSSQSPQYLAQYPLENIFNAIGGTFDSFIPYRNIIISWNAS